MQDTNFGNLFNTIPLQTEEHLETILNTMNKETALYYLIHAVKSAYHDGAYSIGEAEVISKSIRILTKNEVSTDI